MLDDLTKQFFVGRPHAPGEWYGWIIYVLAILAAARVGLLAGMLT